MNFRVYLILFAVGIFSCKADTDEQKNPGFDITSTERYFPNFPDQPFMNLEFQALIKEIARQLDENGFKEDKILPGHFINASKEVQLILPENDKLANFKIFFFNQDEAFYTDLSFLFAKNDQKGDKIIKNDVFSVYNFSTSKHDYSATIFKETDCIRLSYKLKTSH